MNLNKLKKLIREEVLKELVDQSNQQVIDTLSDISLSLSDIQKQLVNTHPHLVDTLIQAKTAIEDVQNALSEQ